VRTRIGAAFLAAGTALIGVTAPSPARAGEVDITPPAVGSCHRMTYDEVRSPSNGNPPVPCSERHTTLTFDVVEFPEPPDWNDEETYRSEVYEQCNLSWIEVLGGNPRTITRSSYTYYWLLPTPAQREAGAAWVRCELALLSNNLLGRLPRKVMLGRLPLSDSVARCRGGEGADFRVTICTRPHQYRATHSVKLEWSRWRGAEAAQAYALRECDERIRGDFHYQWPSSQYWWRLGFRHAVCLKKTPR